MKVNLIAKTPNALKVAFTAIRTCYSPHEQNYIVTKDWDKYVSNNDDHIRLVKQIVKHGHTSTLEHINFTFAISGVSRSLLAQLTRHRVGFSYSVQSQRYVKYNELNYQTPQSIILNDEASDIYFDLMQHIQKTYDRLIQLGIKPEDARYILPNAVTTNITLTCNLRSFLDLYNKRNKSTHAQWEIANLVENMKDIIISEEPWIRSILEDEKRGVSVCQKM